MLDLREFSFIEHVLDGNEPPSRQAPPVFKINNEEKLGNIHDLIWRHWMQGQPDSVIGVYDLDIPLPETWKEKRNDQLVSIQSISAKVQIIGLVLTITGEARQHSLINANDRSVEKNNFNVNFDIPDAKLAVHNIYSEAELEQLLTKTIKSTLVVGRIRIPRIRIQMPIGYIYYPLSQSTFERLVEIVQTTSLDDIRNPQDVDPAQIEGIDFAKLWEPILEEYPIKLMLDIK